MTVQDEVTQQGIILTEAAASKVARCSPRRAGMTCGCGWPFSRAVARA